MIEDAEKKGIITKDTIIVEPTSGNQGIGLALIGAVKGYKTVIIMPDSVSEERRKLVQHYGAEVKLIHDAGNIGECIDECLQTALTMARENPNVYVPQQFENPANPMVHRHHTGLEILEQVAGPIHGFCSGIGTGGHHHRHRGSVKSAESGYHHLGCGAGECGHSGRRHHRYPSADGDRRRPDSGYPQPEIYDDIYVVTDEEAIQTAKDLARKEGLMCGISSGTNVAAALKLAKKLGKGKTVVTVLPDTAERYFSTPLFEQES